MNLQNRPYRRGVLIGDDMGLGKLEPVSSLIPSPTDQGFTPMGDIKVGSYVFGRDGRPVKVLGVYPQGVRPVYRVTFSDGSHCDCGLDHLWSVSDSNHKRRERNTGSKWMTMTTDQIMERGIVDRGQPKFWIPRQGMVDRPAIEFDLDPYFVGVMIGDGTYCGACASVCLGDMDREDIERRIPAPARQRKSPGCMRYEYPVTMLRKLNAIGLVDKGPSKRIPQKYLIGSIDQRIELLRGLMDTDGSCSKNRSVFSTRSPGLASDVKELVDSLGGYATIREYERSDGRGTDIQLRIEVDFCPFHVSRKAMSWRPKDQNRRCKRGIVGIEYLRDEESQCIAVDSPDHLYLTGLNYIVTHNTIQAIGLINCIPSIQKVLIICPAAVKRQWIRELNRWLVRPFQLGAAMGSKWPVGADIVTINPDILYRNEDEIRGTEWDLVVVDECHYFKDPKTRRCKFLLKTAAEYRLALTGTPILNKITDIYTTLAWLDPHEWSNPYSFKKKFCNEFGESDATQRANLQRVLRGTLMVRRLKTEVFKDMPKVRRQVIEVDDTVGIVDMEKAAVNTNSSIQEKLTAALELAKVSDDPEEYKRALENVRSASSDGLGDMEFTSIARIRRDSAVAKIPLTINHLRSCLESGVDKIVVWAHHTECIQRIADAFPGAVSYYGATTTINRDLALNKFINDPKCPLFVAGIRAAGFGLDGLQKVCSHAVIHEFDWVPKVMNQAEDRINRIGQTAPCLFQYLVVSGSIDADMAYMQVDKLQLSDQCLDEEREMVLSEPMLWTKSKGGQVTVTKKDIEACSVSPPQRIAIHECLKILAGVCDGAHSHDGAGFNKIDSRIGKSLASFGTLTAKQAVLGQKLVRKYSKQLPEDMVSQAL